jgi:hypothetical protein
MLGEFPFVSVETLDEGSRLFAVDSACPPDRLQQRQIGQEDYGISGFWRRISSNNTDLNFPDFLRERCDLAAMGAHVFFFFKTSDFLRRRLILVPGLGIMAPCFFEVRG